MSCLYCFFGWRPGYGFSTLGAFRREWLGLAKHGGEPSNVSCSASGKGVCVRVCVCINLACAAGCLAVFKTKLSTPARQPAGAFLTARSAEVLRKPGPTKPEVHLAALPRIASVPAQVGKHVTNCCKRCMPRLVVMAFVCCGGGAQPRHGGRGGCHMVTAVAVVRGLQ